MTKEHRESWREEFDERFPVSETRNILTKHGYLATREEIKSFISSLLSDARKEERERVVEYIKSHSRKKHSGLADDYSDDDIWYCAKQEVLDAARALPSQEVT